LHIRILRFAKITLFSNIWFLLLFMVKYLKRNSHLGMTVITVTVISFISVIVYARSITFLFFLKQEYWSICIINCCLEYTKCILLLIACLTSLMLNLFAYFLFLFRFKYLTINNSKNQMLEKSVILANRKSQDGGHEIRQEYFLSIKLFL
jgi:hypothetical protein